MKYTTSSNLNSKNNIEYKLKNLTHTVSMWHAKTRNAREADAKIEWIVIYYAFVKVRQNMKRDVAKIKIVKFQRIEC